VIRACIIDAFGIRDERLEQTTEGADWVRKEMAKCGTCEREALKYARAWTDYLMSGPYPPVRCPRCEQLNGVTYSVPLRLVKPGNIA